MKRMIAFILALIMIACTSCGAMAQNTPQRAMIAISVDGACDVTVVCGGAVLDRNNPVTAFGAMQSDLSGGGQYYITLKNYLSYDVHMTALRDGFISYSIAYMDDEGAVTDHRAVMYMPVRAGTRLYTNTSQINYTQIDADLNGDQTMDVSFRVQPNGIKYVKTPVSARLSETEEGTRLGRNQVSAEASSYLPQSRYGDYRPYSAVDEDGYSCWVEGVRDNGKGETLTIRFEETEIVGFVIQAGMFRSKESYNRNTRVKEMNVYFQSEPAAQVCLEDVMKNQVVLFDRPVTTSYLTLELLDFYTSGAKGMDTCITQVWILKK